MASSSSYHGNNDFHSNQYNGLTVSYQDNNVPGNQYHSIYNYGSSQPVQADQSAITHGYENGIPHGKRKQNIWENTVKRKQTKSFFLRWNL